MAALAAIHSATPSLQSNLMRSRIAVARQQADQAEAQAQDLRAQADAQEQQVQQARQRVQALERDTRAVAAKLPAPSTDRNTSANALLKNETTYTGILAGVFEMAKPLLQSDLKLPQKNLVNNSLFEATNTAWNARPGRAQTVGRFIDAKA